MSVRVNFTFNPKNSEEMRQHLIQVTTPFVPIGTSVTSAKDPNKFSVGVKGDAEAVTVLLDLWKAKAWKVLLTDPLVLHDDV